MENRAPEAMLTLPRLLPAPKALSTSSVSLPASTRTVRPEEIVLALWMTSSPAPDLMRLRPEKLAVVGSPYSPDVFLLAKTWLK